MFFNFGRFWQNYGFTSQLDTLLERKDGVTLEQIFDEENILNELKNSSASKFAKFCTQTPSNYEKLIDYLITYEDLNKDEKRMIRYQFMSSEIFSSENQALIDFLFEKNQSEEERGKDDSNRVATEEGTEQAQASEENGEEKKERGSDKKNDQIDYNEVSRQKLLYRLFGFLDQDAISFTSAGYFNKAIISIIRKKGYELWEFLDRNPQIVSNLVKHIDITHIADIIEKLIIFDTQSEMTTQSSYFSQRIALLERLIKVIKFKSHNQDIIANIVSIFNEVINRGINSSQFMRGKEIHKLIEVINKPTMIYQFGVQFGIPSVLQVLINLCEYTKQKGNKSNDEDMTNYDDEETETEVSFSSFYQVSEKVASRLDVAPFSENSFNSTFGQQINPLSQNNVQILNLIFSLIQTDDAQIIENISRSEFFQKLKTLVLQNPFNNLIQIYFDKLVTYVFDNSNTVPLQSKLLQDGLLEFISNYNNQKADKIGELRNPVKLGYHGILTKVSNFLIQKGEKNENLAKALQSAQWQNYVNTQLFQINSIENYFLCGVNPKARHNYEDEANDQQVTAVLERLQQQKQQAEQPQGDNEQEENQDQAQDQDQEQEQDQEEQFEDAQEPNHSEDNQQAIEENIVNEVNNDIKESTEEEIIQQKIEEVIHSPQSKPKEISELIQAQEELDREKNLDENIIESKTEAEVVNFFKTHPEETGPQHTHAPVHLSHQSEILGSVENLSSSEELKENEEQPVKVEKIQQDDTEEQLNVENKTEETKEPEQPQNQDTTDIQEQKQNDENHSVEEQ